MLLLMLTLSLMLASVVGVLTMLIIFLLGLLLASRCIESDFNSLSFSTSLSIIMLRALSVMAKIAIAITFAILPYDNSISAVFEDGKTAIQT